MMKPKFLYKYESFNEKSLQNLKAQSIYFGLPVNFNDPYDCALNGNFIEPSADDLERYKEHVIKTSPHESWIETFKKASAKELNETMLKQVRRKTQSFVDDIRKTRGVSCFSERNDDLLMWSHYGGRYKGFCLEFSTAYKPFNRAIKVNYSSAIPKLNWTSIVINNSHDEITKLLCTKSLSWEYEKEWRIFHENGGTLLKYEAEALAGVYFGPDISEEALENIYLILAGQNPSVRFWRGSISEHEFKVNFEEFRN